MFGKAKFGLPESNLHIIIDLSSQLEDFCSVLLGVINCAFWLYCFQLSTQELSSISSDLFQWILTFDSFSLYQTKVLFSKIGSIKVYCAHKLILFRAKLIWLWEKNIMVLITACPQLLNICAEASTARIILFLKSRCQLENPVEI